MTERNCHYCNMEFDERDEIVIVDEYITKAVHEDCHTDYIVSLHNVEKTSFYDFEKRLSKHEENMDRFLDRVSKKEEDKWHPY